LPYFGGSYTQAPFEDITKEKFEELAQHLHSIDLSKVVEFSDETALMDQVACASGQCEIV
jgi:ribonucleoside-diphosphate reductase alpha chain